MALIYIIEDDDSIREIEEFALINAGPKFWGLPARGTFTEDLMMSFRICVWWTSCCRMRAATK